MTKADLKVARDDLVSTLGLAFEPVAVRFIRQGQDVPSGYEIHPNRRYCQSLMEARQGARVLLTLDNVSCPAAAAAFGFKPLPPPLASGEMLAAFGIFASPEAGKATVDSMQRLPLGEYRAVVLEPLGETAEDPDVVVIEASVEQVMWVALASRYRVGGRAEFTTAFLQATCEDATLVPYLTGRLNATLGCYGCRDATDMGADETVVGFPGAMLGDVVDGLRMLGERALPNVRAKRAYQGMSKQTDCGAQP